MKYYRILLMRITGKIDHNSYVAIEEDDQQIKQVRFAYDIDDITGAEYIRDPAIVKSLFTNELSKFREEITQEEFLTAIGTL